MKSFTQYNTSLMTEEEKHMKPLLKFTKKHIKSRDLITLSSFPDVQSLKKYTQAAPSERERKPKGIWFGIGNSWIDWLEYNMPQWAEASVLKVDVTSSKLFNIRKDKDLDTFSEKYTFKKKDMWIADWKSLAKDYDGVVQWKYPPPYRMFADDPRAVWDGWDVRSGCIWNPAAIKKINIIGRYDEDSGEYVR
jgi:hypothetical protein